MKRTFLRSVKFAGPAWLALTAAVITGNAQAAEDPVYAKYLKIPDAKTAGFYERLDKLPDFTSLSPEDLKALAEESLETGRRVVWLKLKPKRYGCLDQQHESDERRLKLKCLTGDEALAGIEYQEDDEHKINDALRDYAEDPTPEKKEDLPPEAEQIKTLLKKLVPYSGITFRGSKNGARNRTLKKGDPYVVPNFLSTSLSAGVGLKFARGETLMIMQTKSCPFMTFDAWRDPTLSYEGGELEVLCTPGTHFEVIENIVVSGQRVVFLREN